MRFITCLILIVVNDQIAAPDEIEGVLADLHGHRRPDGFLPLFEEIVGWRPSLGLVSMFFVRSLHMSSRVMLVMLSDGG